MQNTAIDLQRRKFTEAFGKVLHTIEADEPLAKVCTQIAMALKLVAKTVRDEDWTGVLISAEDVELMARVKENRLKTIEHLESLMTCLATLDKVAYGKPQFGERHGHIHTHGRFLDTLDLDADFLKGSGAEDSDIPWSRSPCRQVLASARKRIHQLLFNHYTGSISQWYQMKPSRLGAGPPQLLLHPSLLG